MLLHTLLAALDILVQLVTDAILDAFVSDEGMVTLDSEMAQWITQHEYAQERHSTGLL